MLSLLPLNSLAGDSGSPEDEGKSYYTPEEISSLCGIPVDLDEMVKVLARQDSMYKEYNASKARALGKALVVPDWKSLMSPIENQGSCKNCWAHAATGVTEGLLHYLHGSNVGIDLDELSIVYNSSCSDGSCDEGGWPSCALSYIQSDKVPSESGMNSFPNYDHAYSTITGQSYVYGINAIKSALNNSPVVGCFYVYDDFSPFFATNPTGIYEYDGISSYRGGHAVVIVGYNDGQQYWLCKNSWGSAWADNGYFRIAYGECGIETWHCRIASVNESCFAKITPGLISSLSTALSYPFVDSEWAYLTDNYTLTDNITVSADRTLSLQSGTTITMNGKYIKSTGGTIIDNGATWNPNITIDDSGSENDHYGTIQSAINDAALYGYGVTVMVSSGTYNEQISMKEDVDVWAVDYTIPGNTVIDVGLGYTTAVTFDGIANAQLRGFTLRGYAGVYCSDSSSPVTVGNLIKNCIIEDSEHGVYCYNSSPRIKENLITDCTYGLMLYNSSNPILRGDWGANTINGSGQGVRCISGSVPELGVYYPGEWGQNQIVTSGYDIYISSSNPEALTIHAQKNWWGPDEEEPSIYYGKPSWNVIWQPALAKIVASRSEDPEVVQYRSSSLLLSKGEYSEAIAGFKGVIEAYPRSNAAEASLTELIFAYREMGAEGECLAYLEETARRHSDTSLGEAALRASVSVLRRLYLGQKALERVSELLEKFKGTQWERDLFFSKGMIYKHNLKAHKKATAVFEEFVRRYPEDIVADFARLELGYDPLLSKEISPAAHAFLIYPNPANPTATVHFELPQTASVSLVIYNLLGQSVRTLVQEVKEAGSHTVLWDGRDAQGGAVGSGLYFARMEAGGAVHTRKLMLIR